MSRIGYQVLLVVLAALSLSGVLATLWVSWESPRDPEVVDCAVWLDAPREGRFRLMRCMTTPRTRSSGSAVVTVGWIDTADRTYTVDWTTQNAQMLRLTERSPAGRRALARHIAAPPDLDILVDAEHRYAGYRLEDPRYASISIWVGVIPFFVFGIPLLMLVRKQRQWRNARLAWERAQGVVTEADKPTAF